MPHGPIVTSPDPTSIMGCMTLGKSRSSVGHSSHSCEMQIPDSRASSSAPGAPWIADVAGDHWGRGNQEPLHCVTQQPPLLIPVPPSSGGKPRTGQHTGSWVSLLPSPLPDPPNVGLAPRSHDLVSAFRATGRARRLGSARRIGPAQMPHSGQPHPPLGSHHGLLRTGLSPSVWPPLPTPVPTLHAHEPRMSQDVATSHMPMAL